MWMGNPKMSSCRDAKGNKQSPKKVKTAWDSQQGWIHLPVGEMLIFFLIVLQPGKLRRRTTTNNVFRKDIRRKWDGFFFFKEDWKKESVGPIPTGYALLIPQEQGRARRAGGALISLPSLCTGPAQAAQRKRGALWSAKVVAVGGENRTDWNLIFSGGFKLRERSYRMDQIIEKKMWN